MFPDPFFLVQLQDMIRRASRLFALPPVLDTATFIKFIKGLFNFFLVLFFTDFFVVLFLLSLSVIRRI